MPLFLVFNTTYSTVEFGLFDGNVLVCQKIIEKKYVNKCLLTMCGELLQSHNYTLKDIASLIAMTGPAPFTTLRVVLATVNGIHTASHIPLIGVDGLVALYAQVYDDQYPQTIILLDAFNDEFYYAMPDNKKNMIMGYATNIVLIERIIEHMPFGVIRIVGNGMIKMKFLLMAHLGARVYFAENTPDTCTLQKIADVGIAQYRVNEYIVGYNQLLPTHLKHAVYKH